jgi:restriction system protein
MDRCPPHLAVVPGLVVGQNRYLEPGCGRLGTVTVELPQYHELLWPTVVALRHLGDSASIEELNERVIKEGGFSDEQQVVLHKEGPSTEIEYRIAWARTYLKGMGLADNSTRGVWSLTERGRTVAQEEIMPLRAQYISATRARRKERDQTPGSETQDSVTSDWREELIARIMTMDPRAFERLSVRLLREAGFVNVNTTPASNDEGIDAVGVYRVSLLSFPVYVQCKRYKSSVGPDKVRDFRGAMEGRGDKGLLITTANFTKSAKDEATRDGATPIDLVDGERLCDLLKQFGLGVSVKERIEEDVTVHPEFFDDI